MNVIIAEWNRTLSMYRLLLVDFDIRRHAIVEWKLYTIHGMRRMQTANNTPPLRYLSACVLYYLLCTRMFNINAMEVQSLNIVAQQIICDNMLLD